MRVVVALIDIKETVIEGDCPIFDGLVDYEKGYDKRLLNIGFWLENWRYCETGSKSHKKSKVFVPWSSALYIEEVKNDH